MPCPPRYRGPPPRLFGNGAPGTVWKDPVRATRARADGRDSHAVRLGARSSRWSTWKEPIPYAPVDPYVPGRFCAGLSRPARWYDRRRTGVGRDQDLARFGDVSAELPSASRGRPAEDAAIGTTRRARPSSRSTSPRSTASSRSTVPAAARSTSPAAPRPVTRPGRTATGTATRSTSRRPAASRATSIRTSPTSVIAATVLRCTSRRRATSTPTRATTGTSRTTEPRAS